MKENSVNYDKEWESIIEVQINGISYGEFKISKGSGEYDLERKAWDIPEVREKVEGHTIINVITVQDKLVNIIID